MCLSSVHASVVNKKFITIQKYYVLRLQPMHEGEYRRLGRR